MVKLSTKGQKKALHMRLPIVMPSNRIDLAIPLDKKYPGRLGGLFSPGNFRDPQGLPYALDNGRFPVWSSGKKWSKKKFFNHIDRADNHKYPPKWLVVPDKVGNCHETLEMWQSWHPRLKGLNWKLALAVQDGMTIDMVKELRPRPDIIFVGGTTRWKWNTLKKWTSNFPRVHLGRANTYTLLVKAHKAGAESSDGTRWFYHDHMKQLIKYLERSKTGLPEEKKKRLFS
jgi:hypothetical protein